MKAGDGGVRWEGARARRKEKTGKARQRLPEAGKGLAQEFANMAEAGEVHLAQQEASMQTPEAQNEASATALEAAGWSVAMASPSRPSPSSTVTAAMTR